MALLTTRNSCWLNKLHNLEEDRPKYLTNLPPSIPQNLASQNPHYKTRQENQPWKFSKSLPLIQLSLFFLLIFFLCSLSFLTTFTLFTIVNLVCATVRFIGFVTKHNLHNFEFSITKNVDGPQIAIIITTVLMFNRIFWFCISVLSSIALQFYCFTVF